MTKKTIFILFLCCVINLAAQNNLYETETKYTPNHNSIFNSGDKEIKNSSSSSVDINLVSSIKFCPTALIRQRLLLFWELDLYGNDFPLNFGIGLPFGNDWMQNFSFRRFSQSSSNSLPGFVLSPTELMNNSTFKGGMIFYGGYKFYFSMNAFDGIYLEPFYAFERMNYTLNERVNNIEVDPFFWSDRDFSYRIHHTGLTLGYGTATGGDIMCTHDFFIRLGAKFFRFDRFELEQLGFTNPEFMYRRSTSYSQRLIPTIDIGYAIGIGW